MPRPRRHVERAPDQGRADTLRLAVGGDGERPEQQARPGRVPDRDGPVADRADDRIGGVARNQLQMGDRRDAGPVAV